MSIVQYGNWKIAVDTAKTKAYYEAYQKTDSQANRNFFKYCENLKSEEKAFFDAFGIDPVCCEIEHIGADKKGNFPCGGYYLICGEYLEFPPEQLMTIDELADNDFIDERPDDRLNIGIFQFDFQCDKYEICDIPSDLPKGFICVRFWCENMKWLLNEKPTEIMYEPPHFWEIHKIVKEKIDNKKQARLDLDDEIRLFSSFFENLNIIAEPLSRKELKDYKNEWVNNFAPDTANINEIKKLCVNSHKYTPYLWHIFSFEYLKCDSGDSANALFDRQPKYDCVIVSNTDNIAFRLSGAQELRVELLEEFFDLTITACDFSWTYSKTHEEACGPYFYKK